MLTKNELHSLLNKGLVTGADFAEIFFEDTVSRGIQVLSGEVSNANTTNVFGVGVRLLKGIDEVYAYTNDVTYLALEKLITDLASSYSGEKGFAKPFNDSLPYKVVAKKTQSSIKNSKRTAKLIELSNIMKNYDERIIQSSASLSEVEQKVLIVNSNGTYQDDLRIRTRVGLMAVAKDQNSMQQSFEGPGGSIGFEIFEKYDFKEIAKEVAKRAIDALSAKDIVASEMPVVIHNGFGGVIFHEACGHPLEATAVAKGLSPFFGKIGEKVASDIVSAYDDGTNIGFWGAQSFDDEGNPTKANLLIENGILRGYLVDYRNGRKMNMEATGSSRRQSYKYSPTSRMTSTYIANGKDKFEDIIKDTKMGLFASKLGGGQVNPATGEFNFFVSEGYMIKDGKLSDSVRGAMLIGNGKDILFKIDRVADNLLFSDGICGSISGSVPVNVGQPTIRVSSMTVGGGAK